MEIVRSIIAVLFVVMALGIVARYTTGRRWSLLLGAVTYGTAGALAIILGAWWPLFVGFAVAWVLRGVGADPPTDLRPDLPTIERSEVTEDRCLQEYLQWWLTNDNQVRLIMSLFIQDAWRRGLRRPTFVPDDGSWMAPTAETAWRLTTASDIRKLATAARDDFVRHLDGIDELGNRTLIAAGETAVKYDLPTNPNDFLSATRSIPTEDERNAYAESFVADAVLSARLRVLAWTFQYWHGERYELPEKRSRT